MRDNKTSCKPSYRCGICNKEHDTIVARAKCEMACAERAEVESKKAEAAKKNAEMKADFVEASAAVDKALELISKCTEKHGYFKYSGNLKDLDVSNMDFLPIRLWNYFLM